MTRHLYFWSRLHCRWEIWRGTLAAWKALPHAVITGCVIVTGAVVLHHFVAPRIVPKPVQMPTVPPWVYKLGLPGTPSSPQKYSMAIPLAYYPGAYAAPTLGYRCKKHHKCKKPTNVSFGTVPWWLLVGLFGAVILAGRRKRYAQS